MSFDVTDGPIDINVDNTSAPLNPWEIWAAVGRIAHAERVGVSAYNTGVGNTSFENISHNGNGPNFPASANYLKVASSSIDDVVGTGTGAWVIRIYGLDANYAPVGANGYEDINLNGTTQVTTTNQFLRVNRIRCIAWGSDTDKYNQGDIHVYQNDGTSIMRDMEIGHNVDNDLQFTVPLGTTFVMNDLHVEGTQEFVAMGLVRPFGLAGFYRELHIENAVGPFNLALAAAPFPMAEKTDFYAIAKMKTGNSSISAGWAGFLIDNPA